MARGFERLFEAVDDLSIDAPNAPTIVSDFLVRSVVDEALPPRTWAIASSRPSVVR